MDKLLFYAIRVEIYHVPGEWAMRRGLGHQERLTEPRRAGKEAACEGIGQALTAPLRLRL